MTIIRCQRVHAKCVQASYISGLWLISGFWILEFQALKPGFPGFWMIANYHVCVYQSRAWSKSRKICWRVLFCAIIYVHNLFVGMYKSSQALVQLVWNIQLGPLWLYTIGSKKSLIYRLAWLVVQISLFIVNLIKWHKICQFRSGFW